MFIDETSQNLHAFYILTLCAFSESVFGKVQKMNNAFYGATKRNI